MGHLVAKDGLDNITALDKGRVVHTAFNQHGADIRMKREDWPRVTERQRWRFMSQLLLEKLSAASAVDEYVLFQNLSCSVGFGSKKSALSRGTTSSPAGELSPSRKNASLNYPEGQGRTDSADSGSSSRDPEQASID